MNADEAQQVADNFKLLLTDYSVDLANKVMTSDVVDYSDSVDFLIKKSGVGTPVPYGTPVFSSRADFEAGQGTQPDIPFQQQQIWHTCKTVMFRWQSPQTPNLVTGIVVIETEKAPAGSEECYLMKTIYSEFNSGGWLENAGTLTFTPISNATLGSTKRNLDRDIAIPL